MREAFGDLWVLKGDLVCITTNGAVNKGGNNVMGAGCALEARTRYPGIERKIGTSLATGRLAFLYLGRCYDVFGMGRELAAFPTKFHWKGKSDLALIEQSARELMEFLSGAKTFEQVLLPRPGCGLGGLNWNTVQPLLASILDDRVVVVGFEREQA